jgi:VanZ like family
VQPSRAHGIWRMTARAAHRTGLLRSFALAWRTRPAVRWGTLAVGLSVYAIASLEPFDWEIPRRVPNRGERTPEGWRFAAPGIVIAEPPHDWLEAASAAETLGLSLVIRPLLVAQSGPARILTMSRDAHMRNLTLAQEDDDLVLRLRTEDTDLNGLLAGAPFARLEDVFRRAGWLSIDLQIRPRELTIALDGQPALIAALPSAVVRTWHPSFSIALGNEMPCDRPWLGEIRAAVLRAPDRVRNYAAAEAMHAPAACWAMGYPPALVPFRLFLLEDAIRNTLMYAPLGLLLGLSMRSRSYAALFRALLVIFGVSVTFEIAQLFVASRFPSVDDTIYNTIGGGMGLALVLCGSRRRSRA